MVAGSVIKGKVIRILSPDSFIVNIGSKEGAKMGMDLVIYEEGQEILGLDGKSLGKVEFVKAKIKITHVQENFSLAESMETEDVTTLSGSIATSLTFKKRLPVAEKEIQPLAEFERTIRKGDSVRSV